MFQSLGDSIPFGSSARLEQGTTNVSENINQYAYKLEQNYPNPFNPTTHFEFHIGDFGFVSLKIFDVLGKEITTLVNEELLAGKYEINFYAKELTSGIYFYQIKAGSFIQSRKMILLK
jgi:hypothetical protein